MGFIEINDLMTRYWVDFFTQPSQRLFWPFLLSPLLLIIAVNITTHHTARIKPQLLSYINPRVWCSRSSLTDLNWLLLNSVVKRLLILPLIGSKLGAAMWLALTLQQQLGDTPLAYWQPETWQNLLILTVFSLLFFISEDASRYGLHRLMHHYPWLWRFHKTHHSAEQMTPLTLHRVHTVEMLLYYLRSIIVFALLAGSFTWLFRSPATVWQLMGVDALGFMFNLLGANLRHSHVALRFGRLERWFISPAQHQLHHSNAPEHQHCNFGTCLAIWDQCSKSLLLSQHNTAASFGLAVLLDSQAARPER